MADVTLTNTSTIEWDEGTPGELRASVASGQFADATHNHAQSDITGLSTALSGKADTSHTHSISNVTNLQTSLDGKSSTSHNHDASYAGISHNHDASYASLGHSHASIIGMPLIRAESGWYIGPPASAVANLTMTANTLYATPLVIPEGVTVTRIGCRVATGVTSAQLRLGIWSNATGNRPGNLVHGTAALAATSSGSNAEETISLVLNAGVYWIGAVSGHAAVVVGCSTSFSSMGYNASGQIINRLSRSFTMGALGNEGSNTFNRDNANSPMVWVRAA